MSRYIDAHFAQLIADEELDSSGKGTVCWVLAHTPTADVVQVVRCKDCKYFSEFQHCGVLGFCEPNEYCSRGERRKGDADIH